MSMKIYCEQHSQWKNTKCFHPKFGTRPVLLLLKNVKEVIAIGIRPEIKGHT